MLKLSFFEIPAEDFNRALDFYKKVFGLNAEVCDCGNDKMGFIELENIRGAIFKAQGFKPSTNGIIISFEVDDIDITLEKIIRESGKIDIPKTKIEAENMGYFALFVDCEGNRLGLHSN